MSIILHISILLAIGFRILLFSRGGRYKPFISVVAYLLMVSAFTEAILAAAFWLPISIAQLLLELALALALYAHHGNVAELFKATKNGSQLSRLLCWSNQPKQRRKPHHKVKL